LLRGASFSWLFEDQHDRGEQEKAGDHRKFATPLEGAAASGVYHRYFLLFNDLRALSPIHGF
jgi:hypothetical protein